MKATKLALVTAVTLVSSAAMANVATETTDSVVGGAKTLFQAATHPAAVSLELGTQGYGANVAWGVNESTELQLGWAGAKFDVDTDFDSNDSVAGRLFDGFDSVSGSLKLDVKANNPYLGVQMRPLKNWLTVGTGVIVPKNEITAVVATKSGAADVTVDGTKYTIPDNASISMKIENHNKLAPYLTVGFRPNINNRFGVFAEVGAAYYGKYDVEVKTSTLIASGGKDLADELKNEVKGDKLSWYPIAKLGATLRF